VTLNQQEHLIAEDGELVGGAYRYKNRYDPTVKILAISDVVEPVLYGASLSSYTDGVEAVISCGDLPFEYLEYVITFSGAPLYYVRGNHDPDEEKGVPAGCISLDGARRGRGGSGSGGPLRVALVFRGTEPVHRARDAAPGAYALRENISRRSGGPRET
jgi:uncharacterized protein